MNLLFRICIIGALALVTIIVSLSADAADSNVRLTRQQFQSSVCNIDSMSVDFKIGIISNELMVRSKMRWLAGPNTAPDCISKLADIFVEATLDGASVFIKISPRIIDAGQVFGSTVTVSPDWDRFMCYGTSESASCLTSGAARRALDQLQFETIQVVAESSIALSKPIARRQSTGGKRETAINAKLLAFVDTLDAPAAGEAEAEEPDIEVVEPPPVVIPPDPAEIAQAAVNQVSSLLSSTLARYSAPSHSCESERHISNWIQVVSTCKINFRRESSHEFLCAEGGEQKKIRSTEIVELDFARDINSIGKLRYADDGSVILVLRLNDDLASIRESYDVDRWQFIGVEQSSDEMQTLANSFTSIKEYCEVRS